MIVTENAKSPTREFLKKMLMGAVFGAAATALFLILTDDVLDHGDGATMVAVVAGLSYGLMGLLVAFGALAPSTGARFLNVEDADEIREERPKLAPSAVACALVGAFLLLLAFAGGAEGREVFLLLAGACLAGIIVIGVATRSRTDELIRQIGLEASALTFNAGVLILAVWATLAQLGYAAWVEPLGLISGAALLHLFSIFAIAGKRGMMRPR